MSLVSLAELADPDGGPKYSDDGNIELFRSFEVIDSDPATSGAVVSLYPGLPAYYDAYPTIQAARCVSLEMRRDPEQELYWVLRYRYTTKLALPGYAQPEIGQNLPPPSPPTPTSDGTQTGDAANPIPTLRPPTYRFSGERYTEYVTRDILGEQIQNAAGEPYDPTGIERTRLVLTVQRNIGFLFFNPLVIETFVYATNSVDYLGWEPHTVLLEDLSAEPKHENRFTFWDVSAKFVFSRITIHNIDGVPGPDSYRTGGWFTRKVNAGFKARSAIGAAAQPAFVNGSRPDKPVLLDANGLQLAAGLRPNYLKFLTYPEKDFNLLNLFA